MPNVIVGVDLAALSLGVFIDEIQKAKRDNREDFVF